jgi:hypothetical protein
MPSPSDLMTPIAEPTAEQAATRDYVLDLARAWEVGALPLPGVRSHSTGQERNTTIRCTIAGSDERALMNRQLDALIADADQRAGETMTTHGHISQEEKHIPGRKDMVDHTGNRVWVWPMFWMHDEPYYPLVSLPPGEDRRQQEEAMLAKYRAYRKKQKRDDA